MSQVVEQEPVGAAAAATEEYNRPLEPEIAMFDFSSQNNEEIETTVHRYLPPSMHKSAQDYIALNQTFERTRASFDVLQREFRKFQHNNRKMLFREAQRYYKKVHKKRSMNMKGFNEPMAASDELCAFMGKPPGLVISRIDFTRFLMNYLKENNLKQADNRQIILPDEKLWRLLGEEARGQVLKHFSVQKYLKSHFTRISTDHPATAAATSVTK